MKCICTGASVTTIAATLLACSGGAGPKPPAPPEQNVAGATNRQSVLYVEGQGRPLIVDWQPEQRGDLEIAMKEGVAVVAYSRDGLELLSRCRIDGNYGFIGISRKEQVIRLVSEEEIKANLPLSGLDLAAKLGGELARGSSLDIGIVMVGKRRTTWENVTSADLDGDCDGATHFVRGATIGAFAMSTGMRDRMRSAAELFGAGIEGGSESSASMQNRDGSIDGCKAASPDGASPPPQCSALIRLELSPILSPDEVEKKRGEADGKIVAGDTPECPQGLVFVDGKCAVPTASTAHDCRVNDPAECRAQCDKGSAQSCDALAYLHVVGANGAARDEALAASLFAKSCDGGFANGCLNLAIVHEAGRGVPQDPVGAAKQYRKACELGSAIACTNVGRLTLYGIGVQKDNATAFAYYSKGCEGGDKQGCNDAGFMVLGGMGTTRREELAASYFDKSCNGGVAMGCSNAGYMAEFGHGRPRNLEQSVKLYEKACQVARSECMWLAILYQIGKGVPADIDRASQLYGESCAAGATMACVLLNVLVAAKHPLDPRVLKELIQGWVPQCKSNTERDCTSLGYLALVLDKPNVARDAAGRACLLGDEWGCDLLQRLGLERPETVPRAPTIREF